MRVLPLGSLFVRRVLPKHTPVTLTYSKPKWYDYIPPGKAINMTVAKDVYAREGDELLIKAGTPAKMVLNPRKKPDAPAPALSEALSILSRTRPQVPPARKTIAIPIERPDGCTTAIDGTHIPLKLAEQPNPFQAPGTITMPATLVPPLTAEEKAKLMGKLLSDEIEVEGRVTKDVVLELPNWHWWCTSILSSGRKTGP